MFITNVLTKCKKLAASSLQAQRQPVREVREGWPGAKRVTARPGVPLPSASNQSRLTQAFQMELSPP